MAAHEPKGNKKTSRTKIFRDYFSKKIILYYFKSFMLFSLIVFAYLCSGI